MNRKTIDCRDFKSENNCSLMMAGDENELIQVAAQHAVSVHGHTDSPELRDQIRKEFKDEPKEWSRLKAAG